MAEGTLVLHSGGRTVTLDEVNAVQAPPPEGRWYPLAHGHVLGKVKEVLGSAGFLVHKEKYGLSHQDARFFGVLDLTTDLAVGVSLSVGVRNSNDRTFPIGFCAGSRVFCCDNLAFSSELLVRKKHTRYGATRFADAIGRAVVQLGTFKAEEARRIRAMREADVGDLEADSLILRAFETGIVNSLALPKVIREWREPSFDDFRPRNRWSIFNAFTTVLGKRADTNPHAYAAQTMRLTGHLTADLAIAPEPAAVAA